MGIDGTEIGFILAIDQIVIDQIKIEYHAIFVLFYFSG